MKFVGLVTVASGEQVPVIMSDEEKQSGNTKFLCFYDYELSMERGIEGFKEFTVFTYDAYDEDELSLFKDEIYNTSDIFDTEAALILCVEHDNKKRVLVIDTMESTRGKIHEMVTGELVEEVDVNFMDYDVSDEDGEGTYVEEWEMMYDKLLRAGR